VNARTLLVHSGGASLVLLVLSGDARADVQACFETAVHGQELRRSGKLLEARDAFVACGKSECPAPVAQQCTTWLEEVDEATPSIIVTTHDELGRDLTDAVVLVDGVARPELALGRAVSFDPGPHTLVWRRATGATVQQSIVLRERERGRVVTAVFSAPPRHHAGPPSVVYVLAGTAAVGAAVFAVFAAEGYSDRQSLGCDVGCSSSQHDQVRREFVVADSALGVTVVALAAGLWFFLQPRAER
jgi:hypothetical protein